MVPKFQHITFRAMDLLAVIASSAYTGAVAGMIAFKNASDNDALRRLTADTFLPVDTLIHVTLASILLYELLAAVILICHLNQCDKVLKAANLPRFYWTRKAFKSAMTDPLYRQQYQLVSSEKTDAMKTTAVGAFLMAVGIVAALYLSNTGVTPDGWLAADKFGVTIYAAPSFMAILMALGLFALGQKSLAGQPSEQKWISLAERPPRLSDVRAGFIGEMVLCRSPYKVGQWSGNYRACKVSKINSNGMPPAGQRAHIEWTQMPE